jgi:AraC-like DNA-binding protein
MVRPARVSAQPSAGQTYRERGPCQALAGLISSVWVQRVAPDAAPYAHRAIPNGSVEFRCQVGSAPQLVGPLTRPLVEVFAPGGVGPKALQRMLRFQGFLARVQLALSRGAKPAGDGLAQLAADVGYANQSHLTRECLRLTGVTPRAFLRETQQHCGCGHDHEVSFAPLLRSRGLPHSAAV